MFGDGSWLGFADLRALPEVGLNELVISDRAAKTTLEAQPVPGYLPSKLLWAAGMPDSVVREHRSVANIPANCIYAFPNAEIGGPTNISSRGRVVAPLDVVPGYVVMYYINGTVGDRVPASSRVRKIAGPALVVTNFWCQLYGHFLLESLGRILTAARLAETGHIFPIVVSNRFPSFVVQVIQALSPLSPIVLFDEEAEVVVPDVVLLPGMGHTEYDFHSSTLSSIDAAVRAFPHPSPGRFRKIYVSRERVQSVLRTTGRLSNEPELRAGLERLGYETVHIQEYGWKDQVALFRDAQSVIGEQGSGLHNAIFSTDLDHLVSINRMNLVQQRIASARGHPIGFVIPDDGRLFDDVGLWDYTIDVAKLTAALEALEGATPDQPVSSVLRPINHEIGTPLFGVDGSHSPQGVSLLTHVRNLGDIRNIDLIGGSTRAATAIEGFEMVLRAEAPGWLADVEYRARLSDLSWSDWVRPGGYVGSRGIGSAVTGFGFRVTSAPGQVLPSPMLCRYAGIFEGSEEVQMGQAPGPCVSPDGGSLCRMQVIFYSATVEVPG